MLKTGGPTEGQPSPQRVMPQPTLLHYYWALCPPESPDGTSLHLAVSVRA